jgi:hypothetical protein
MPGETTELWGQYPEVGGSVRLEEDLDGLALLDFYIRLSYSSEGAIWRRKFVYSCQIRFHVVRGANPGFSTTKAEGN